MAFCKFMRWISTNLWWLFNIDSMCKWFLIRKVSMNTADLISYNVKTLTATFSNSRISTVSAGKVPKWDPGDCSEGQTSKVVVRQRLDWPDHSQHPSPHPPYQPAASCILSLYNPRHRPSSVWIKVHLRKCLSSGIHTRRICSEIPPRRRGKSSPTANENTKY